MPFQRPVIVHAAYGSGGSGGAGSSTDANGSTGTAGTEGSSGDSDGGGGGGGGGAGGPGGNGGIGAGGGILISAGTDVIITGTVETLGNTSDQNGGTVKLYYNSVTIPSVSGISAGRIALFGNLIPSIPSLMNPTAGETNATISPTFIIQSIDSNNDYLRYRIEVCSTSNCSSVVRTMDQTVSQSGWLSQSRESGTAYDGAPGDAQAARHLYQTPVLSYSTQYWWRAQAIDPGGTNIWSDYSLIQTFTTQADPGTINGVQINGNTTIQGGSTVKP